MSTLSTEPADLTEPGVPWTLTLDCADPVALARFWALALGHVPAPPPTGSASWPAWFAAMAVPEQEWDDGAALVDPEGNEFCVV